MFIHLSRWFCRRGVPEIAIAQKAIFVLKVVSARKLLYVKKTMNAKPDWHVKKYFMFYSIFVPAKMSMQNWAINPQIITFLDLTGNIKCSNGSCLQCDERGCKKIKVLHAGTGKKSRMTKSKPKPSQDNKLLESIQHLIDWNW